MDIRGKSAIINTMEALYKVQTGSENKCSNVPPWVQEASVFLRSFKKASWQQIYINNKRHFSGLCACCCSFYLFFFFEERNMMLFVVNVIILNDLRAGVSNIRRADQNRPTRGSILMNIMGVPNHDKKIELPSLHHRNRIPM